MGLGVKIDDLSPKDRARVIAQLQEAAKKIGRDFDNLMNQSLQVGEKYKKLTSYIMKNSNKFSDPELFRILDES